MELRVVSMTLWNGLWRDSCLCVAAAPSTSSPVSFHRTCGMRPSHNNNYAINNTPITSFDSFEENDELCTLARSFLVQCCHLTSIGRAIRHPSANLSHLLHGWWTFPSTPSQRSPTTNQNAETGFNYCYYNWRWRYNVLQSSGECERDSKAVSKKKIFFSNLQKYVRTYNMTVRTFTCTLSSATLCFDTLGLIQLLPLVTFFVGGWWKNVNRLIAFISL